MTIESYSVCLDILNNLNENGEGWGKIIYPFLENYNCLELDERILLNKKTPASIRYILMYQYLGHFIREAKNVDSSERQSMLKNSLLLIGLDNSEDDYRETILVVGRFFRKVKESLPKPAVEKIWKETKDKLPNPTKEDMELYFDRWNEQSKINERQIIK